MTLSNGELVLIVCLILLLALSISYLMENGSIEEPHIIAPCPEKEEQ